MAKSHSFEDAFPPREEELIVKEIGDEDLNPEDCPILFDQYGSSPLLEFSTDDTAPWLELDTVVRLRDMLTEWIEQHPDNQKETS